MEERMAFMKQQALVLQLMGNSSLYFVHLRKRPSEGANSESCAAFRRDNIKAPIPSQALFLLQGVPEPSPGYHMGCGIYGYATVRLTYRSHLETVERVGESMWQAARICVAWYWIWFWFLLFKVCVAVRVAAVTRFFDEFLFGTSLRRLVGGKASGKYNFKLLGPIAGSSKRLESSRPPSCSQC